MKNYDFKTEKQFSKYVLIELKKHLKGYLEKYNLKIYENIKVLKDITIIPDSLKGYLLTFGFSDVDIVIFKEIKPNIIKQLKNIKNIKLESLGKENNLIIPFVIIELKLQNVNSHSLILYSRKVMEIKDKFPYCIFNMVIFKSDKKDITILRHSKGFERVISLNKKFSKKTYSAKDSINDIIPSIKLHLDKLAEREIIL